MFFLSHLVSITHPPFQVTISMSGGSGAEDCRAGLPPEDESNASRLRRDADAVAVEDLDCNEHPAQGANAVSAKVRHSLTLLVLFCLYSFLSNCNEREGARTRRRPPWTATKMHPGGQVLLQQWWGALCFLYVLFCYIFYLTSYSTLSISTSLIYSVCQRSFFISAAHWQSQPFGRSAPLFSLSLSVPTPVCDPPARRPSSPPCCRPPRLLEIKLKRHHLLLYSKFYSMF